MTQKTVLVTGASRVAVADLDRPDGGSAAAFFRCDVSSEASVRTCVRALLRRFGPAGRFDQQRRARRPGRSAGPASSRGKISSSTAE
jgi:NAD(P)-dependent dehydrogenase (short-subunit alcohol dehydrogenase family)